MLRSLTELERYTVSASDGDIGKVVDVLLDVAFPLRLERCGDWQARAFVLSELGIEDASSKLPGQLSGGMAKRVGIARAVVTEPEILVYDEPTSGIDAVGSCIIEEPIERMRASHGVTSVVITHDMVTAYGVADHVVLLADGKAVAEGPPEELFRSHGKEIEPFAVASGIDLARLPARTMRKSPAMIRKEWTAAHSPSRSSESIELEAE